MKSHYTTWITRYTLLTLICIAACLPAKAQFDYHDIATGQFMLKFSENPYNFLLYDMMTGQNADKPDAYDTLRAQAVKNFLENPDSLKYQFLDSGAYMLVRKNSKVRFYRVVKHHEDFVLLCKANRELCKCKEYMAVYFFKDDILQNVDRPFGFSFKKNLHYRLEQQGIELDEALYEQSACTLLNSL
jgi:hypothetical protein